MERGNGNVHQRRCRHIRTCRFCVRSHDQELASRSNSCITAISSEQIAGHVFVAGYGNGKIMVFDQREKPATAMVQRYSSHKQWITNVHVQRGGMREIVSASRNGEVKLWDIRKVDAIRTIHATRSTLRSLSVHEHAPVFATYVPAYLSAAV